MQGRVCFAILWEVTVSRKSDRRRNLQRLSTNQKLNLFGTGSRIQLKSSLLKGCYSLVQLWPIGDVKPVPETTLHIAYPSIGPKQAIEWRP
jgi:hypothetical protein